MRIGNAKQAKKENEPDADQHVWNRDLAPRFDHQQAEDLPDITTLRWPPTFTVLNLGMLLQEIPGDHITILRAEGESQKPLRPARRTHHARLRRRRGMPRHKFSAVC